MTCHSYKCFFISLTIKKYYKVLRQWRHFGLIYSASFGPITKLLVNYHDKNKCSEFKLKTVSSTREITWLDDVAPPVGYYLPVINVIYHHLYPHHLNHLLHSKQQWKCKNRAGTKYKLERICQIKTPTKLTIVCHPDKYDMKWKIYLATTFVYFQAFCTALSTKCRKRTHQFQCISASQIRCSIINTNWLMFVLWWVAVHTQNLTISCLKFYLF